MPYNRLHRTNAQSDTLMFLMHPSVQLLVTRFCMDEIVWRFSLSPSSDIGIDTWLSLLFEPEGKIWSGKGLVFRNPVSFFFSLFLLVYICCRCFRRDTIYPQIYPRSFSLSYLSPLEENNVQNRCRSREDQTSRSQTREQHESTDMFAFWFVADRFTGLIKSGEKLQTSSSLPSNVLCVAVTAVW